MENNLNIREKFDLVFEKIENSNLFFKWNRETKLILDGLKCNYVWRGHGANNCIIINLVKNVHWEIPSRITIKNPEYVPFDKVNSERIEKLYNILK